MASTKIDWDHMTALKNILDDQSQQAHGQQQSILGLSEEAAAAWTGKAGATWVGAVNDWIKSFGDVITQLDTITHELDAEVAEHIRTEHDNIATAGKS